MINTKVILILFHLPLFAIALYALGIWKKLKPELKILAWYLVLTGVLQIISLVFWFLHINNLPILHFLVPLRFVLLVFMYKSILSGYVRSWVLDALMIGFCAFSILNTLFFDPWNTFNSNAMTVESIVMIILSLSTYVFLMDKRMTEHLKNYLRSAELMNSGVFIYYTSSLLLTYFGKYIIQVINPELSRYTWIIHGIFSVIMYYYFWRALWKQNTT